MENELNENVNVNQEEEKLEPEKIEPIIIDSKLPPEILKIENDFCESMIKFGVSHQYVEKYRDSSMGSLDGWDFGSVDPEQIKREKEEADIFAQCIELEEELAVTPSFEKAKRQQLEAQIAELTELAELYKNERIALKIASGIKEK